MISTDRLERIALLAAVDLATARELLVDTDWSAESSSATSEEFEEWLGRLSDEDVADWLRGMAAA